MTPAFLWIFLLHPLNIASPTPVTPASLSPSFPLSKRPKFCVWTDQLAAAAGNVCQANFASFSQAACSNRTRRNKNTSQFSTKFPTKFLLLCTLPPFPDENWPIALKLAGVGGGQTAWSCKSCSLRKPGWNRKSWVLSVKGKMLSGSSLFIFPNILL